MNYEFYTELVEALDFAAARAEDDHEVSGNLTDLANRLRDYDFLPTIPQFCAHCEDEESEEDCQHTTMTPIAKYGGKVRYLYASWDDFGIAEMFVDSAQ